MKWPEVDTLAYLPPLHIHIEAQPHDDILGAVLPASTKLIGLMLWDLHGIATPQPQVRLQLYSEPCAIEESTLLLWWIFGASTTRTSFMFFFVFLSYSSSLCLRSWG